MIFYFSGTGNSQAVAREIGRFQKERLISISQAMEFKKFIYELKENEKVIFIFPIHAGLPPQLVSDFIKAVTLTGRKPLSASVVVTCAYGIGRTDLVIDHLFEQKGWSLHSFYIVIMPTNYLIVGRVDDYETRKRKLQLAQEMINDINQRISRVVCEKKAVKRAIPSALTLVSSGVFLLSQKRTKAFFANDDCISCKVCEKVCPTGCITVFDKPKWTDACIQCLACLHYCPKSAIQYGNCMEKKSRYTNPHVPWYQLNQNEEA